MPNYGYQYVVGETYRSSSDPEKDEFQGWLNGPIDNGIRNSGGIRAIVNSTTGEREFLVFVSSQERGGPQNPWEDVINREEGIVRYWGDAKARDNPNPENANGNSWVKNDYCETYAQDARKDAPPVLLFEKPRSGEVTFQGVCILTEISIERYKDGDDTVVNYLFNLAILDVDTVDLEWIHRKSRTGVDVGGPDAWNEWVDSGRVRRYSIYRNQIRSKDAQLPDADYQPLLDDIRSQLDNPKKGEKMEFLVQYLLETLPNFSQLEQTPTSGDRGVDLEGRIDLLPDAPLGSTDTGIEFKAQVKNKGSSVSGKELSRLASRVEDGEIGLFFTTSHYTRQAQEENLAAYPVRLFSGGDIVKLLAQTELVDDRTLADRVVKDIETEVSES
ncbi:hypothetical protein FK85_24875 [Halorubrum saccharovorum]|uniref:Restriction endonuclease n=1 Tax=Halorubrum saccharovorum TaxID=2248 RepID=A0A0F8AYJ6_9EURY|nr:restriction endonuclease [Halorubrum saccharovorum]KKF39905.1 hypothetical protein FK85_24875 [Halorubrum saccharovorum]